MPLPDSIIEVHCLTKNLTLHASTNTAAHGHRNWLDGMPAPPASEPGGGRGYPPTRTDVFPFPILGIDTDNGGEVINEVVVAYCEREQITFTRGRSYQKRDQCFVEQKNGVIVRQVVGYDHLVGVQAYRQLTELYGRCACMSTVFSPR